MSSCTQCGGEVATDARFCTSCGRELAAVVAPAPPAPTALTAAAPLPPPVGARPPIAAELAAPTPAVGRNPAEGWRRLVSWAIDGLVVALAVGLTSAISGGLGLLVLVVGLPAYYVLLVGRLGVGTIGHQAMRLAVRDDRTGTAIGEARAALRLATIVLGALPFLLGAVASATGMFRRPDRRAWQDLVTQSSVTAR